MYGGGFGGGGGGILGGGMGMGPGMHGPGMGMRGGLLRGADLSDEAVYGKVYDQTVVVRLAGYLKDYKFRFILAVFAMIVSTLSSLAMPLLISRAIDAVTGTGNLQALNFIFLEFIAAGVANWGALYAQQYILAYIGRGVLFTLRMQMFTHIQKLTLSFFDRNEVGRIMSRVQNDVAALQEVITTGVLEIMADFLSLGVIIFILFTMDVKLTLIGLAVVPALVITLIFYTRYSRNAFVKVRQAISVVNASLQENISGARVIQAMSRENINFQRFDTMNESNLDANLQATRLASSLQGFVEVLSGIATALLIIYGGAQVISGNLLIGGLIGFVLYVQRFFEPIRSLAMQYTQLQRATAGGLRIFEVLDAKPDFDDAPDAVEMPLVKGDIVFDNVSFEYNNAQPVLQNINLHVQPGETFALVGATGAGKSTLVALVSRFYDVSQGAVTIDGYDIRKVTQESLRRQIGIVLQEPFLFSGTIKENITYGNNDVTDDDLLKTARAAGAFTGVDEDRSTYRDNRVTDEEMIAAARAVGAHDFIMRLEKGYDTILQERGSNLSVGQRQLISFARAVLANPKILILDEATANIDTQTEVLIQKALKNILKGRTSLIIAHRLSTIHDADRVIVLDGGKIVEIGNHQELLAKGGYYHHLYTMSYALADVAGTNAPTRQRQAT